MSIHYAVLSSTNDSWIGSSKSHATSPRNIGLVSNLTRSNIPLFPHYKARTLVDSNWRNGRFIRRDIVGGHSDSVYCLQFDELGFSTDSSQPDAKTLIVSGSRDQTVKFWALDPLSSTSKHDTLSCRPIRTLRGHKASVLCLQYDRDLNSKGLIVTGSSDRTIKLWDFASMDQGPIATVNAHSSPVLDVRMDKRHMYSASKDCSIKVWNLPLPDEENTLVNSIALENTLEGHAAAVNAIQLFDGYLVSASGDCTARLWDLKTGAFVREMRGHLRGLASVYFTPPLILTGSNDRTIRMWDLRVSERSGCVGVLEGHTNLVRTIDMGSKYAGGEWKIVSGSYDESIKIWDQRCLGKSLLRDIDGAHTSWVFGVACNATKIVSASQVRLFCDF
jgi:F-box and WD-40 domain protein 1/11